LTGLPPLTFPRATPICCSLHFFAIRPPFPTILEIVFPRFTPAPFFLSLSQVCVPTLPRLQVHTKERIDEVSVWVCLFLGFLVYPLEFSKQLFPPLLYSESANFLLFFPSKSNMRRVFKITLCCLPFFSFPHRNMIRLCSTSDSWSSLSFPLSGAPATVILTVFEVSVVSFVVPPSPLPPHRH